MLVLDDDAVYTAANDAACQVLDRPRHDIVGHSMGFTTQAAGHSELYDLWEECRSTGFVIVPWQFMGPDGRTIDVEAMCTRDTPEPGHHLSIYWQPLRARNGRRLSRREQEVTSLLAAGLNGEQIAQRLYLSPETVRTHIRNAMNHMGAQTRAHLVGLAVSRGLISTAPDA